MAKLQSILISPNYHLNLNSWMIFPPIHVAAHPHQHRPLHFFRGAAIFGPNSVLVVVSVGRCFGTRVLAVWEVFWDVDLNSGWLLCWWEVLSWQVWFRTYFGQQSVGAPTPRISAFQPFVCLSVSFLILLLLFIFLCHSESSLQSIGSQHACVCVLTTFGLEKPFVGFCQGDGLTLAY